MSWFVRPEITTLSLPDGETLTVRRRLTAGQQAQMYKRMYERAADGSYVRLADGTVPTDPAAVRAAIVLAYLVDWSLTDDQGARVRIDPDRAPGDAIQILDSLDPDRFADLYRAIEAHHGAMRAERGAEKNALAGAIAS